MIAILTPTYNRIHTLPFIYKSLIKQTNKNFIWIVVDDGSTDNTKNLIDKYIKLNRIKIKYCYKDNGGKHTALNYGIKKINSKYTIILDSDDYLVDNAIELINNYFNKYDREDIACISFLKMNKNKEIIPNSHYEDNEIISNNIDFRYNKNILGDMQEVYKTSILKKYPFPIFNKEKFLSEAIVWNKIALKYKTVYINKPITISEYNSDGLSKNFFKLVYNNPIGAYENSNQFLISNFKLKIKIKNSILYVGYGLIAKYKLSKIIDNSNNKLLTIIFIPLGFIYSILLKIKNM